MKLFSTYINKIVMFFSMTILLFFLLKFIRPIEESDMLVNLKTKGSTLGNIYFLKKSLKKEEISGKVFRFNNKQLDYLAHDKNKNLDFLQALNPNDIEEYGLNLNLEIIERKPFIYQIKNKKDKCLELKDGDTFRFLDCDKKNKDMNFEDGDQKQGRFDIFKQILAPLFSEIKNKLNDLFVAPTKSYLYYREKGLSGYENETKNETSYTALEQKLKIDRPNKIRLESNSGANYSDDFHSKREVLARGDRSNSGEFILRTNPLIYNRGHPRNTHTFIRNRRGYQ